MQHMHNISVFWGSLDVSVENMLYIYIYDLICDNVVRGLQGVSKTIAHSSHYY